MFSSRSDLEARLLNKVSVDDGLGALDRFPESLAYQYSIAHCRPALIDPSNSLAHA